MASSTTYYISCRYYKLLISSIKRPKSPRPLKQIIFFLNYTPCLKIGILNENVEKSAVSAFRRRMRVGVGIGKMMKKKMAGVNEKCSICRDFENKKIKINSNLF